MRKKHVLAIAIFSCTACSSLPVAKNPECPGANCTDKHAAQNAPQGAILSYSECSDGLRKSYVFIRNSQTWALESYEQDQDSSCQDR